MSRKSKRSNHKKKIITNSSPVEKHLDLIGQQIFQKNYAEAITQCERLLNYLPQRALERIDVLCQLGIAQGMLQNFFQSYDAFTEALALDPNNAELWYNRSRASGFTSRAGQAVRDLERAVELNKKRGLTETLNEALAFNRELAEAEMAMRGPNFTLDQLIEQENHFQQGLILMRTRKWEEAEQAFRATIAMGDCLSQPWGNLGMCLMMQERYDEAEEAMRRALVFDPEYALAKNNLALLAETRLKGPPNIFAMSEPFKNSKLEQSVIFIKE